MAVTLDVPPGVLRLAERAWDDAHDKLSAAGTRLDGIVPAGLSTVVSTAVTAFLDVWSAEIATLVRQASAHAGAFADLDADLEITDAVEAARLRSLLPYAHRDATIRVV
ncbi:hypothetical protein ACFQ0K_11165 [Nocardioides caeni]|uniref:PE domain-containing protein n=1 Tax=Nocardioides caeni TaxID=574700 RepID=A0A4S8NR57_9ACTN|nr:hypothetical protein [Nocardioides caeni]THV17979.1 hypothetical protein E9934_05905 [Nocardioides caeni]